MSDVPRGEIQSSRELRPLAEHLDDSIEDVSVGVSALLAKIVRQSLRSGIQKLDEGLEDNVRRKIDVDLEQRGPELDAAARESAKSEVTEQVETLRKQAKESGSKIVATIENLDMAVREERKTRSTLQDETDGQIQRLRDELGSAAAAAQKRGEDLERALAAKLQSAAQALQGALEKVRAESNDRVAELQKTIEQQRTAIEQQRATIKELRTRCDLIPEMSDRTTALEEKVFKPGFFGRLFGKKGGPPGTPQLPPPTE